MQHSSAHVAVARCMCLHAVLGGLSPTCMFIRVHFCPRGLSVRGFYQIKPTLNCLTHLDVLHENHCLRGYWGVQETHWV